MKKLLILLGILVAGQAMAKSGPEFRVIYGVTEEAGLSELGVELPAKLDTGAVSASLSAYDKEFFDRDGEEWVRFRLGADKEVHTPMELPVDSTVLIRRRAEDRDDEDEEFSRRPVVLLELCMGNRRERVRVNLTDRRDFSYPLLVGREALKKLKVLVDPREKRIAGDPACVDDVDGSSARDDE